MLMLSTSANAAKLLYENTFSNGFQNLIKAGTPYLHPECDRSYWPGFTDPTGGNNPALHFNVPGNLACGQPASKPKHRASVAPMGPNGTQLSFTKFDTDYWAGYRLWLPSSMKNKDNFSHYSLIDEETVFHLSGGATTANLSVKRRYWEGTNSFTPDTIRVPLPYDQWNNLVVRNKRSLGNTGAITVWLNGRQVVNLTNVRTAGLTTENHTRVGIYWGIGNKSGNYELYIDDWRIAEGPDGYDLVNPQAGGGGGVQAGGGGGGVVESGLRPPSGLTLNIE